MRRDWSEREVLLVVEAYFEMLGLELRGIEYNKTEYRRRLIPLLDGRSNASIELKHENISAILRQAGFPYIDGYKPLPNYQRLLADLVLDRLGAAKNLTQQVEAMARGGVSKSVLELAHSDDLEVDPPGRQEVESIREYSPGRGKTELFDYATRDAENAKLGSLGEQFIMEWERHKLRRAGRLDLARKIEWVAREQPSAGFDVRSFDLAGKELLIEVKTTKFNARFPFMITRNEVAVSERCSEVYRLYRLFRFNGNPRFFVVPGAVSQAFRLDPRIFEARR